MSVAHWPCPVDVTALFDTVADLVLEMAIMDQELQAKTHKRYRNYADMLAYFDTSALAGEEEVFSRAIDAFLKTMVSIIIIAYKL